MLEKTLSICYNVTPLRFLPPEQSNFFTDHYIIEFQIQQTFRCANPVPRNVYDYKRGNLSFEAF